MFRVIPDRLKPTNQAYPYVTGTSVVALKYKDGILIAADMGDRMCLCCMSLMCSSSKEVETSSLRKTIFSLLTQPAATSTRAPTVGTCVDQAVRLATELVRKRAEDVSGAQKRRRLEEQQQQDAPQFVPRPPPVVVDLAVREVGVVTHVRGKNFPT
ncbi:hypothetical protein SLEP1_g13938 [Rubroshorea leprosula]|uniref:Uncharacterized protein n=1 Tax=Rubroshorea leprosula TaxID=152421 RepID=A0AAV5IRY1_9ROSI|nr:hypothetical protein SLEP1_g13938 [Rubroshorea leprosula]